MVKKKLPVRWSPKAEQRLDGIYDHIAEDSVSSAKYVKKSLIQLGGSLGHFPKKKPERNTWLKCRETIGLYQNGGTSSFTR